MQATETLPRRYTTTSKQRAWRAFRRWMPVYLLILPGMAIFLLWTLYPLLYALVMSFFNWNPNPAASSTFLGWGNYSRALQDPIFWQAFRNVVVFSVGTVPAQMIIGLGVALLLDRKMAGRDLFRVLYYLPVITSWVVWCLVFEYLFNSQGGLVNWVFGDVFHLIPDTTAWIGSVSLALPTIMITAAWKGVGWTMVIFLAGLQSIPPELYEAASIDGAGSWDRFRHVTVPLLRPVLAFVSVILTIGAFGTFLPNYIMTGPEHSTESLLTYGYTNAFSSFDFG
ncbi:MAG: binding-protein-dependent transport system inner rane protein, partial [Chloroflexi bacterium]|nr:binding-protein-dependent transport system inner rane protein [Chloroflexota bacterium]